MRTLTYFVAVTLDGYIAAPDGGWGDFPTDGDHLPAIMADWSDTIPTHAGQALGLTPDGTRFDTVLMGWHTYAAGLPHGVVSPYQHLRQYVVSSRPHALPPDLTLVDDPLATVRRLKDEPEGRGIWLCGGGRLAATLVDEIDELALKINPLLLGAGIPLFGPGAYLARRFRLVESRAFASGVLLARYERLR